MRITIGVAIVFCGLVFSSFAAAASFQGLGFSQESYNRATAISSDGSVVVGQDGQFNKAFAWTANGGMVLLDESTSIAWGVSADGSVVVGSRCYNSSVQACYWTADVSMVGVGVPYAGVANCVSADGLVVVGGGTVLGSEAFRWTAGDGVVGLGDLPGGVFASAPIGVSADGSVIVGSSISALGQEAFCWTADGGMIGLGDLNGDKFGSIAYDVSADGSVVVGHCTSGPGGEAFIWTSDEGMIGLGDLDGGTYHSGASAVSADGSIVVGYGSPAIGGSEAIIWDADNGMRNLKDILSDKGLDMTGWTLTNAIDISDDGLTIIGHGFNPDGYKESWIATIPEPATVLLFGLGAIALRKRRKA